MTICVNSPFLIELRWRLLLLSFDRIKYNLMKSFEPNFIGLSSFIFCWFWTAQLALYLLFRILFSQLCSVFLTYTLELKILCFLNVFYNQRWNMFDQSFLKLAYFGFKCIMNCQCWHIQFFLIRLQTQHTCHNMAVKWMIDHQVLTWLLAVLTRQHINCLLNSFTYRGYLFEFNRRRCQGSLLRDVLNLLLCIFEWLLVTSEVESACLEGSTCATWFGRWLIVVKFYWTLKG